MNKIIFDLDGTLLDSRKRLYVLFKKLVPEIEINYEEYWNIKAQGVGHWELINSKIGQLTQTRYDFFQEDWMRLIESPELLDIDKPYSESNFVLDSLKKKGIKMYLCTARQRSSGVEQQLENFNWLNYFNDIYVTEQKTTKVELLKNNINWKNALFIGDTSQDINLAKSFGGVSIAVTYGFRSKEYLINFNPDYLIDNIKDLTKLV